MKRRLQRIASTFNARARKLRAPGVINWQMLVNISAHENDACRYCNTKLRLEDGTWDHIIPLDKGGSNEMTNIARCCWDCQRRKFTKTPDEFRQHQQLTVTCARPGCGKTYQPRWAEWQNGRARTCSHQCAGAMRRKK